MFAFVAITKLSFLIGSPSVYAFVTQLDCDHSVGVLLQVSKLNIFKLLSLTRTYQNGYLFLGVSLFVIKTHEIFTTDFFNKKELKLVRFQS